jgi:hypothetical protein
MGTLLKAFNLSPFNNLMAMVVDHDVMFSNLSCGFSKEKTFIFSIWVSWFVDKKGMVFRYIQLNLSCGCSKGMVVIFTHITYIFYLQACHSDGFFFPRIFLIPSQNNSELIMLNFSTTKPHNLDCCMSSHFLSWVFVCHYSFSCFENWLGLCSQIVPFLVTY